MEAHGPSAADSSGRRVEVGTDPSAEQDRRDGAGGPSGPSASTPTPAELALRERELAERVWGEGFRELAREEEAQAQTSPSELLATPQGLDWLDLLPETHPVRVALRIKVHHVDRAGVPRLVARDWSAVVPTEEYLGRLVEAGELPAGEYRVKLWRGSRSLRHVVLRLQGPPRGEEGTERELLREILRDRFGSRSLEPPSPDREQSERLETLETELQAQGQRLDQLQELAAQLLQGMQDARQAPEEQRSGVLERLAEGALALWMQRQAAPGAAPEAAPDSPPYVPGRNGR